MKLVLSLFLFVTLFAETNDPLEGMNRGTFWFNNQLDDYFLEPVAKGYDYVVPDPVQDGVRNVFRNLSYPGIFVSDLIALEFAQSGKDTARFLINSTLGVAGIFDVAEYFGIPYRKNDIGLALARNGVSGGPYLVLPLLGPSNVRDGIGLGVGLFLQPMYWFQVKSPSKNADGISMIVRAVEIVNLRSSLLDAIDSAKEASVDYYGFTRSAYEQLRSVKNTSDDWDKDEE